ncbi:uncharacterized protein LOC135952037 [Calliphora vicina]|uniref:uncharacterized protein LOC135952037 n=1 Tax=Calliphora vicina TaxID=7373 RepID=UPI00325C121A
MSQNNQRKHYHIHAPYQHPQQQQQQQQQQAQHHHHHLSSSQQQQHHHQQQQQQWYSQQHYQHGLHIRDSRHIQHSQHHHHHSQQQQPHHNHTMAPHMFTSGYVGMTPSGGVVGGVGGASTASGGVAVPSSAHNAATMGSTHNMPASSSSAHHYSSALAATSASGGGSVASNAASASSGGGVGGAYVGRSRIFDLEMLTAQPTQQHTQHGVASAAHSHSMLSSGSTSGRAGFDAYSHNSLYSQPNQRHHSSAPATTHHHLAAAHHSSAAHSLHPHHTHHHAQQPQHHTSQSSLHHHQQQQQHHQQQQQQQPPPQQHYYHHAPQTALHRPHSQVMPPMLQHIKSEPVEQITVTPSIQTEEIIIKSEPVDDVSYHKSAPQIENNSFHMEEKRKQYELQQQHQQQQRAQQQQLHEQQLHQHQQQQQQIIKQEPHDYPQHHSEHTHNEDISQQIQHCTNSENSTTILPAEQNQQQQQQHQLQQQQQPQAEQQQQISLTNIKTEAKPLNFPRRKLQTERSSTLPICQRCKQVFLKRQNYTQHVAQSSCNIVEYDFKCSVCPMSFMSNEELQTHEQLHRSHRYFCQKYCGKFYETIDECEQHEYGQHEYEMYKCNICCISVTEREQLYTHLNEHKYQPRYDCCICRLCFQTSLELHDHYMANEDFCGKYYDKEAFNKQITSSSSPYLGKPESSNLEIAHTFSLKDIPPGSSHHLEPLYAKPSTSKSSMEPPTTPTTPSATAFSTVNEFALEPHVEVKTEIKVEPDFYPPMDQSDFSAYDNDYSTPDYNAGSNQSLAFLHDYQDNASSSTNSSYSFNNNDAIQDDEAICCVPKCGVRKFSSPSLQFFGFPRDEKYLAQWLHNLKMVYDPNVNYSIYRICSLHFPKRCIAKYSLSYWAVPTFNLGHDDVGNLYQNRESSGGFPAGEMAKCSMPGCPSQRGETNVKFHVFPRDLKTLIKWCQNSRLPVHSKDNRFFCSRHFEEKCFGKFRLKPWAIPTLNLGTVYGKIHDNPNIYQEEKKCFLPFCRRSRSYDCNLSLYRFPRDETLLRRWCYNLRLDPNMYRGKNHKICSSHFIKEALGLRKLNPGAVPTLNLGHNDRFNIYENELYTPPPPPPPQPSTSSKAHKYAELFKQEMGQSSGSHIYDGVFMSSMVQKFSSSSASAANNSNNLDLGDVCLVPSCKRTRHSADITLHTVPKRPEQLKKWCHNLKMDLMKMHKSVRICSAHFEKYCIGGCMRPFAVPTLELGHEDSNIFRNPDVIKKLNIRETCCIQSCKRNRDRDHANLHRFPTHPELLQKWCENLQKPIPDGTKLFNDAVCEIHFEDRCLRNKRLEKWAIPTMNLGWDEAPHCLPSEEEINENWVKPFAPNNGDEQGECCVVSCKRNPQIDDVKLYRPPEDAEQLVKWAHNLMVDVTELPNLKICNLHFEQHCIGKRLLNWAMPTLNLGGKVEHLFENPPPMPTIYKKKIKPERILSTQDAIKWSPRCCLPHCRKMRSVDKVHLFRFPYNNRQTLAKWCHNLQLPLVGSSHRRICSSHFETSVLTKRCPMSLAVPTLDLNAPPGYKIYQNPARLKQIKMGTQRQCIIESCRKTKLDGVSLFRFPNNRSILYKWRHNIKNWPKCKLSSQLRICAEHFEPHSVGEKKLSPGAIPTLKLGHEAKDLYPNETRSFFDLEKCVVNGCDSRKEMEDIRLFRFPRDDDELLKKWCNNLKMNPNDCVGIKICSKHFEPECLGPRQLYKWCIPTLKLGHQEDDLVEIIPNPPPEQRAGEFLFKCCVPTCGKTRKYDDAQMNSFPKNLKLFRKWKHNLKIDFLNFKEREKYKICNDHFEAVCVGKTRLNFGALPTLNLGHEELDDLYQINPDRIRPNLFIKQKDAERLERRRIMREENREQYECDEPEEDASDPLSLEPADIKCCVNECSAPKSIMREPYELPETQELKQLWLKEFKKSEEVSESKVCGLHFQLLFKQLKPQMLEMSEENPDLKTDFNKLQYNYQKSNISLVINSYQCRVEECPTNLLNSSIRLFFFPYGKHLVNKWSHNTGIIPDEHRRYMNKVCALHFESYCITENQRLRSWAIPTLNLPPSEEKHLYKNPDLTKIDRRMLGPQIQKCAVTNCNYEKNAELTDDSIKLFNFPCDDKLLKKWCDNLKMSNHFTPLLKICSLHFEKLCFGSCRIRSWAIPTLYLGHDDTPEHLNKTTIRQEVFDAPEDVSEIQLKQVKIKKSLDSAKCYVPSCRKSRLKHGVRFYSLPTSAKMKRKWLHNLQITHQKSSHKLQNVKICNQHFHKRCLEGKQLKPWAVPTMHLGHTEAIFDNPRKVQSVPAIRCALTHCRNHSVSQGVRLFVFPKSPEFLEKWSKNLKLDLDKCKGKICQEHFEKDVIGEKKLKNGAVPTLNLDHKDIDIFDNSELIEKLKVKEIERELKQDPCRTKLTYEQEAEQEYEPHTDEEEDEEIWESEVEEEEGEEEEEEEVYYDDDEQEEEEEEEGVDEEEKEKERHQEDDENSVTTSITDWSSIKFKELRVSITPLTPEDLMDLCSRSSYEREFGSLTPASSLRGRRSITPASSLKELSSETPEQKPPAGGLKLRSETPDYKSFNCFREPRSVTPDQRADNFRSPELKTDPLNEILQDTPYKTPNLVQSPTLTCERKSQKEQLSANTLKRESTELNAISVKRERLELSEDETNEMDYSAKTNLRTDKALNAVAPMCCLKHCGKEKTPEQHLTTYGFPKDPQLLQKWCDNLGLQPEECIGRVCIDHFELRVIGTRRLKLGAVPTLNLGPNRLAKHSNLEDTPQKKSVTKEFSETGNMQESDSNLKPPPPYKTPKPSKQSVFRLCCLKHCRRKKFVKQEKKEKQDKEKMELEPELLFKFPSDEITLKKWYKNLRLPEKLSIPSDLQICSKHFEANVIKNKKLHAKAVPTLQLSYANREPIFKNNPKDFVAKKIKKTKKEKCYLAHCGNVETDHIFLISFPLNEPMTVRKWCRNLRLSCDKSKLQNLKICNQHFEPYVFFKKRNLRAGAIPTLNLGHTQPISRNCRKLRLKRVNSNSVKEKCCIAQCEESNLKLYAFPRSSELRKIWCNNLQIELRQALNNHYKVCSKHFSLESFMVGSDNLKINAVPVLHLGVNNESHLLLTTNPDESKCLVENCQKTPSVDKVKLFKFPAKPDILKKWLFNLNLSTETFKSNDVICSKHFDKSCIKNGHLHENAIPTKFLEVSPKGWFYKNNEELYELTKKCCVLNCEQTSEEAKHLYRFPKHKEDLEKWLYNLKLQVEETEVKDLRVCDRHFEQSCKISNKDLITQALPTLNLGHNDSDIYGNNFIKCCLDNCGIEGFYYHKLPEDLMLQSFWFQELEMETTYNTSLYICSVHFVAFFERILEKYSAFLKESKEYVKLLVTYNELKALPGIQCYKCNITKCNSGFKLIWKLFKFPKDQTLFNKWLHNTGLTFDYEQRNCYRICAQHFEERCLSEKKLHRWSLPTLKLPFNNSLYVNPPEALPSNHENLKHCCVSNCLTHKGPFYKFPIRPLEIKKWIHNLDLGPQQCTLNLRVCFKHFENYCFSKAVDKVKPLKAWSVPTLKLKRKSQLYLNPADKIAFYVCCIPTCRQILNKSKEIYLFKFPFSNTLKQKWLHNLSLNKQNYRETMRICSAHFEMDCFHKGFKLLRKHSVPTLALNKPPKEIYTNPARRSYLKCCVKVCQGPWQQLTNFPKDKTLLRKWSHNLQLDKQIKLESLRDWKICTQHFEKSCVNKFGMIRSMAVPTLKLGHRKKLFKNPNFTGKTNIKKEREDKDNEELKEPAELNEIKSKEDKILKEAEIEELNIKKEINATKAEIETETSRPKSLRPLRQLRKPERLINTTQQKVKIKGKKDINKNKIETKGSKEEKTNNCKQLKANNNLESLGECIKEEEKTENLKQDLANSQNEANNEPENFPNSQQEEAYLENLLEILTETDNVTELTDITETIKKETKKVVTELEHNNLAKQEKQSNKSQDESNTFTIYEIKLETVDFNEINFSQDNSNQDHELFLEELPQQPQDEYLEARADYEPSEHSDHELHEELEEEEKEKSLPCKGRNFMACCIKSCKNYGNFQPNLTLFKLPPIRKLRDEWLTNCKLNRQYSSNGVLKRLRVCIEHFDKQCLKDNSRLLFGAVPTLKLRLELDPKESLQHYSYLRCRVQCCQRSQQYDKINKIQFPSGEMKTKWCSNLNLEEERITEEDWICHRHFERKALIDCRKPKPGMLPTLLLDSLDNDYTPSSTQPLRSSQKCCVKSCDGVVGEFCKFPSTNLNVYTKWLNNLKLQDSDQVRKHYFVCFKHFDVSCFLSHGRLKIGSVPTLYLEQQQQPDLVLQKQQLKLKCRHPLCKQKPHEQLLYDWPNNGIFRNIWLEVNKLIWQLKQHNISWENESLEEMVNIPLCKEHFCSLYEANKKAITNCNSKTTAQDLVLKVKETFENLNNNKPTLQEKCSVPQCSTNQNINAYKSFKLFGFPKAEMAKKWCHNIGIYNCSLKKQPPPKVCEIHFQRECFNNMKLLHWAVPTLNLPNTNTKKKIIQNNADEIFALRGQCCIKTCANAQGLQDITQNRFYKFPKDPDLLKKWLENTNCHNYEENVTRICGLHFQLTDINHKNKTLKENAVPQCNLETNESSPASPNNNSLVIENIIQPIETSNCSPNSSIIDDYIEVKQELDNSEEWCEPLEAETQITENVFDVKFKQDAKEQDHYPLLDIKQEILEIQEEQPMENPSSLFTIQKFESPENYEYSTPQPQQSAFVISDVKSQIYLCCVQKCTNNSETPGIRLFTEFPSDSEIFIKWCFNLKIDPRNYQENQYNICQQHFEAICFTEQGLLQPWSVPTLNLNLNENSFIHQNDIPDHLKTCTEQCIVYGCINPLKPLYKFPYHPDISHKWFANLKLDYTDFRAQNYRICKRHFSHNSFELNDINKLKMEAVPTLYLGHTDKILPFNNSSEEMQLEPDNVVVALAALSNQDNSRGSSQGSLARLISPHDLEDHDSSYFEDFEEYYGQDE